MIRELTEIGLLGVWDRGVPNKERVVMQCHAGLNLQEYCLICGPTGATGSVLPSTDHFYKFPNIHVSPNSWIVLYTGGGQQFVAHKEDTGEPVHALYWGQELTVFSDPAWRAAILRIDGIVIASQ